MQKYFKCLQCGKHFIAEDDLSVQCPFCGSDLLQPVNPRKAQPWMYPAAFILFLAIGFGVSEIVQPKLFVKANDEITIEPDAPAELVEEIIDEPTIIEEEPVADEPSAAAPAETTKPVVTNNNPTQVPITTSTTPKPVVTTSDPLGISTFSTIPITS